MATPKELLQAKLDDLNAQLAADPDPRDVAIANIEATLLTDPKWFDMDVDAVKAFLAAYAP